MKMPMPQYKPIPKAPDSAHVFAPSREISSLVLSDIVRKQILGVVDEQRHASLLHSHKLHPRNRILLIGPPGNGKTSLAGVLAHELKYPLVVVRYENLVGSYLGETSSRISKLLDFVKTLKCVLFFDEFDTVGKERGDQNDSGEIKRVVSSLLLQLDALPDSVVLVAASNHSELLDRAIWRRFQVRINLPYPCCAQIKEQITAISKIHNFNFGYSAKDLAKKLFGVNFAVIEEFLLDVIRKAVISKCAGNAKDLTDDRLLEHSIDSMRKEW